MSLCIRSCFYDCKCSSQTVATWAVHVDCTRGERARILAEGSFFRVSFERLELQPSILQREVNGKRDLMCSKKLRGYQISRLVNFLQPRTIPFANLWTKISIRNIYQYSNQGATLTHAFYFLAVQSAWGILGNESSPRIRCPNGGVYHETPWALIDISCLVIVRQNPVIAESTFALM